MLRALFLTNQFFSLAGAEITVVELAEEFVTRGWQCDVKAPVVGSPLGYSAFSNGIGVDTLPAKIDVTHYDMVWCQHGTLANIDFQILASRESRPTIICSHLSPYMPVEQLFHPYTNELVDLIVVNSPETAATIPEWVKVETLVSHNPAPQAFFCPRKHSSKFKSILCVSNHLPGELSHVLLHLHKNLGVDVKQIGFGSEYRRVNPKDITDADIVITIGKSAQYALASRTPTYLYDHFGGDGWITNSNFDHQMQYNFSGRPFRRMLSSEQILTELEEGYSAALEEVQALSDEQLNIFNLTRFVDKIIERCSENKEEIMWKDLDKATFEIIHQLSSIHQQQTREKYKLNSSDIWSKPSLDIYFGRQ